MLIALLMALLLGPSGGSHLSLLLDGATTSIKADISDKGRRTELLSLVDEAGRTTKEHGKAMGKIIEELADLGERQDAQAGDILPAMERLDAENESYQERMVGHFFALKGKMTREEWTKAFSAETVEPEQK